ncbi:MAG TPA: sigma-70 factor domain-containing protein, partial [Vicinamibacteria bacterium]|nr:sigma-70 factor domain-containing protein [Vicinamibacteria bacterium]
MPDILEDDFEVVEAAPPRPEPEAEDATTELDVLGQYLKETHRYPLLNREQEQKVSRAMRRSEAVLKEKKVGSTRKSARKEFDDTRAKMIESNLRLVVSIAKRYKNMGMELSDLVQEGNI